MAGIINYIHGEKGVVQSVTIERDKKGGLFRVLRLSGNPFRYDVLDYGRDIRVDPALRPGDEACYIRLDPSPPPPSSTPGSNWCGRPMPRDNGTTNAILTYRVWRWSSC